MGLNILTAEASRQRAQWAKQRPDPQRERKTRDQGLDADQQRSRSRPLAGCRRRLEAVRVERPGCPPRGHLEGASGSYEAGIGQGPLGIGRRRRRRRAAGRRAGAPPVVMRQSSSRDRTTRCRRRGHAATRLIATVNGATERMTASAWTSVPLLGVPLHPRVVPVARSSSLFASRCPATPVPRHGARRRPCGMPRQALMAYRYRGRRADRGEHPVVEATCRQPELLELHTGTV